MLSSLRVQTKPAHTYNITNLQLPHQKNIISFFFFFFTCDLWSVMICSIYGCNIGGLCCVVFGLTSHNRPTKGYIFTSQDLVMVVLIYLLSILFFFLIKFLFFCRIEERKKKIDEWSSENLMFIIFCNYVSNIRCLMLSCAKQQALI